MQNKVYNTQTKLTIEAQIGYNITGLTVKLKYKSPTGKTGDLPVSVIDPEAGIVQYIKEPADPFLEAGDWWFWAHITFPDGHVLPGAPFKRAIFAEGP